MKALRLVGRALLVLLLLLACASSLVPAVARAQFAASGGGGVVDVLGALLGKDVTVQSLMATAGSGVTGMGCTFNGCRIDFGAGANDYASSSGGTITFGASIAVATDQSITTRTIGNQGVKPLQIVSTVGTQFFALSLPSIACGTDPILEGTLQVTPGGAGASKVCMCLKDGSGTLAWTNMRTNATGTTTSCP